MTSKYLDRTPKGWLLLDELGLTLLCIPNHESLGFIVSMPGTIVFSRLDNLHTIYIYDHKAACGVSFLETTIKLYMHSLAQDKAHLW